MGEHEKFYCVTSYEREAREVKSRTKSYPQFNFRKRLLVRG